jgi:hypothetical protein
MSLHPSAQGRNTSGILGNRFDYAFNDPTGDLYPGSPGFVRSSDTSREAAESFTVQAASIRARVLGEYIKAHPFGLTGDDVAARLGLGLIAIRPRVAELHTDGTLADSGERRTLPSGRRGAVLVLADGGADAR